jgi:uncharacterized membrane protein YebE (DUF533 family)
MFDAKKLLGQMVGDAMSGAMGSKKRKHKRKPSGLSGLLGGTSTATKAKVGIGLIGLAIAAFEHFKDDKPNSSTGPSQSPPPPPSPPSSRATPPPPPPTASANNQDDNALHLIRAMIAAADADGLIDDQERSDIISRAKEAGFDDESLKTLATEIQAPFTLKQLIARTPEQLRDETYAAALIAISADTDAERQFLEQLAQGLQLSREQQQSIHEQVGL